MEIDEQSRHVVVIRRGQFCVYTVSSDTAVSQIANVTLSCFPTAKYPS